MQKIIERIYKYIEVNDLHIAEFERNCSLSNGYLKKMRQRNADIGEGCLMSVIENCPRLSVLWLVTGEGSMLKNGVDPSEKSLENSQIGADESDNKAIQTLKDIIKEQAHDIARLEIELERLKAGTGNALNVATA